MSNEKLVTYIEKHLKKGIHPEKIKSALLKAGHDLENVEKALSQVFYKNNIAKIMVVVAVFVLILALMFIEAAKPQKTKEEAVDKLSSSELQVECRSDERTLCTSPEGYIGYRICQDGFYSQECFIANLDDCSVDGDKLSNICCKAEDGSIYDCNEKTNFAPGEYVMVKVNLQKAMELSELKLDAYKACAFSPLLTTESEIPEHYERSTEFSTDEVGCSSLFYSKDFHQASLDGFVPDTNGLVNLAEVRIYPDTVELADSDDAQENIGLSKSVFSFEVDIGE